MSSSKEVPTATEAYAVGPLDIFLLFSFVGFLIYWFMRKKESKPEITGLAGLKKLSAPVPTSVDTSGFLAKMKKSGKTVAIFYGSQTGTAEEFSQRLSKDCQGYGLKAGVFDPEECEMEELVEMKSEIPNSLAVFIVATYGEGDPTDNALPFSEWLKEDQDLEGLNYAVFSLGNKTYEHYQAFGRFVDKRVEELGGVRIHKIGEGDDDGNIEEDFVQWREEFWKSVCEFYDINVDSMSNSVSRDYQLKKPENLSPEQIFQGEMTKLGSYKRQRPPYDAKNPYMAKIVVNRELHKAGDRSCMHIEIDITDSGIKYEAGDHVGVFATNDPELVELLGKLLNVDLDEVISLDNVDPDASKKHPFPCPCSYRTALLHYVDITTVVKPHILAQLANHTSDPEEVNKLKLMSNHNSKEGKELYNEWIVQDSRHIVAVIEDLKTCKPPIDLICELMPRLQCRYYSISSSPKLHKNRIHVTAVLVDWISRTDRRHKGVATFWLKNKQPGDNQTSQTMQAPIFVRHTTFRLPVRPISPVLMVGPGTGLAPFRGFIQERDLQKESGEEMGDTILYFGCRKRSEDYIYEEELTKYAEKGSIDLQLAFSRDQAQKYYVTHRLRENLEQIWDVLKKGGHLYVCGDARHMAKDVHDIFIEAMKTHGGKTEEQANSFLKSLNEKGRYSVDVWS